METVKYEEMLPLLSIMNRKDWKLELGLPEKR